MIRRAPSLASLASRLTSALASCALSVALVAACAPPDDGNDDGDDDGPCASDADCDGALCYDLDDDTGLRGACVPGPDLFDACRPAQDDTTARESQGPALLELAVGPAVVGCLGGPAYGLTFRFLDREGDVPAVDSPTRALFVRTDPGADASSFTMSGAQMTGDAHAALVALDVCGQPPFDAIAAWLVDEGGHRSNVLCANP